MTTPFSTAEDAWMWAIAPSGRPRSPAVCDPRDITRVLDMLYRRRRIDLIHARILRVWGERQIAPSANKAGERADRRLWEESLGRLDWPLRVKGIVA